MITLETPLYRQTFHFITFRGLWEKPCCCDISKLWALGHTIAGGGEFLNQKTQNICILFVQRRPNVFDVDPTLYKCYTYVLCLQGNQIALDHSIASIGGSTADMDGWLKMRVQMMVVSCSMLNTTEHISKGSSLLDSSTGGWQHRGCFFMVPYFLDKRWQLALCNHLPHQMKERVIIFSRGTGTFSSK